MILVFVGSLVSALALVLQGINTLIIGGTWTFADAIPVPAGVVAIAMFLFAGFVAWWGYSWWQSAG
ncbi:MAG: hypothetical protein FWD06_03430 [Oscillospiraceae bacterium]|nr:hypothetical protein [Oscillospiraceae bacterium]